MATRRLIDQPTKEKKIASPVVKGKKKITDEELKSLWKDQAYSDMSAQSEVFTSEHAQAKAIVQLTESKDPEILTHLKDNEIAMFSSLSVLANVYSSDSMKMWITKFIRFRISLERKGRGEVVEIAKSKSDGFPYNFGMNNPFRR